ncbi:MAG: cation transporter [Ferruginibacter sp.]
MKSIHLIAVLLFGLFTTSNLSAQTATIKKETIKVWGNCGSCKKKIEKAAKAAGATAANWNEDTQELKISYNSNNSSSEKIQQSIANVGYDTQDFKGDDQAYKKLDACCKYPRKAVAAKP